MKNSFLFAFISLAMSLSAQPWVDTVYSIQTEQDVSFGTSIDFAGNTRSLLMDISYPINDFPPECGRPLMIIIHGGAFLAGDKTDGTPTRLRKDFARRGYTTASVNYRLGQFQTHQSIHCNISNLGVEWDCLNMADSSEWYRACFRGIQDVNGAIRYLVNNGDTYQINPENIFLVGESAGGFIAMGAGFMDDPSEVLSALIENKGDVSPPNNIYESPCIQSYQLDTSIASMDLARPNLGSYEGTLNLPLNQSYQIKAVGSFFGGVFNNIFSTDSETAPALYLFHQPNDLIVPFNLNKVFAGYAACATQFPFNCQYIVNRPFVFGSKGIKDLIDTLLAQNLTAPEYLFDVTNNSADCTLQLINPSLVGHAIDNYWLRTSNMAAFFAEKITDCPIVHVEKDLQKRPFEFSIYPNPAFKETPLTLKGQFLAGDQIFLRDAFGKSLFSYLLTSDKSNISISTPNDIQPGIYYLQVKRDQFSEAIKLIVF